MKLKQIFNHLTHGELSQLALGGAAAGEITEQNYGKIISSINLGLTDLYGRFPLRERRIQLALQPGRVQYPLTTDFALTTVKSKESVRFILDSASDPFIGDVLKISQVFNAIGLELGMNDRTYWGLTTPYFNTLVTPVDLLTTQGLPEPLKTQTLSVVYRANHPCIDVDAGNFDPETYEVGLPDSHLMALLLFIASRLHNPIGMINEFHSGNSFASKYEMECERLKVSNVSTETVTSNTRLTDNGWV